MTALQSLRPILDAMPSAIMILTPEGKVELWSRGAVRIFGWRREEVEGGNPPFTAPEDAARDASLRQRVLAGNEVRDQATQRSDRDGEVRDLIINAIPQRDVDKTVTGIIIVMEDVTDRRRIEAGREREHARMAAILDAIPDPIVTLDEAGAITGFSRGAEASLGYIESEVIGRDLSALMQEAGSHLRFLGAAREIVARRKDGSTFPAEFILSEGRRDGDRFFIGLVRPPSRKASSADAKFLSLISHDLRQPIQALSLVAGALERRTSDPAMRDLVDHLGAVVRSTQSTFESIVEWTRLERALVAAAGTAFDVHDVMTSLAEAFEEEAGRRGLQIRCVGARARIRSDPVILRRILHHLLDNAMKFTPAGKVLLGARRRDGMLRMIVADSGLGIPANKGDAIFAAFSQLDAGREAGGLGLGLAIAQRLARMLGTEVGFRSTPGKGSMFWVDLPAEAERR